MSHQETVPPEQEKEQQQANGLEAQIPDPEVVPKARRRQFTAKYKLRILEEADRCTERGQIGELLAVRTPLKLHEGQYNWILHLLRHGLYLGK